MLKKILAVGDDARAKFLKGALTVGEYVGRTLGPGGRNALIAKKYKSPPITKDGVTVARYMRMNDELEDLGAQVIVESAMKTNETAGDGTTTTVVLATALIADCDEKIKASSGVINGGVNVMEMGREIERETKVVLEMLKTKIDPIDGRLVEVASTSMDDEAHGKVIAGMLE